MREYEEYDIQAGLGESYSQLNEHQLSLQIDYKRCHYDVRVNPFLAKRLREDGFVNFAYGREKRSQVVVLTFTKRHTGIQLNKNNLISNKEFIEQLIDVFALQPNARYTLEFRGGLTTNEEKNIFITKIE